jgi:hypothetical protein
MRDLLPGDRVHVLCRRPHGRWCDKTGTVTWANDQHGRDRLYDVRFDDPTVQSTTFVATEIEEIHDTRRKEAV